MADFLSAFHFVGDSFKSGLSPDLNQMVEILSTNVGDLFKSGTDPVFEESPTFLHDLIPKYQDCFSLMSVGRPNNLGTGNCGKCKVGFAKVRFMGVVLCFSAKIFAYLEIKV